MKRRALVLTGLLAVLVLAPRAGRAEDADVQELVKQIDTLTQVLQDLQARVAALETRLAAAGGIPPAAPPGERHPTPAPPAPSASGAPTLTEHADRFTGEREVVVRVDAGTARHRDDPQDTIPIELRWTARRVEGQAPTFELRVESAGRVRRWPEGSTVYLLVDGRRSVTTVGGVIGQEDGRYVESITLVFDRAFALELARATTVEARAGVWELVVPKDFRDLAAQAIDRVAAEGEGR